RPRRLFGIDGSMRGAPCSLPGFDAPGGPELPRITAAPSLPDVADFKLQGEGKAGGRTPLSCGSKRLGCASPGPAFSPARGEKDIEHSRRHPFAPRRCPYAIALSWQARPLMN